MANTPTILDRSWVNLAFMLPSNRLSEVDKYYRDFTTANLKFTDTRLGGNFSINNLPQFTHTADIPCSGILSTNQSDNKLKARGMGRYYSEAIDDNAVLVHFQFGVPSYNGMLSFFTGFYNSDAGRLARTGTDSGLFYSAGKVIGFVASLYALPLIAVGAAIRFLSSSPSSKYYYLKPTMAVYWNRVQSVVNTMAVNMGIVSRFYLPDDTVALEGEEFGKITDADRAMYNQAAPDIFGTDGGIDIYNVATRAQRAANAYYDRIKAIGESSNSKWDDLVQQMGKAASAQLNVPIGDTIQSYTEAYHKSYIGKPVDGKGDIASLANSWRPLWQSGSNIDPTKDVNDPSVWSKIGSWLSDKGDNLSDNIRASIQDANAFATFKVDYGGTVEESFTNSATESEISSKVNGISSAARSARFDFSDGNTGIAPLDAATGAVKDVIAGAVDSVAMSGLIALAGSAFVDIPKRYDGSSVSMPRSSYTIELRSPYGNAMARFQNLYVPLAMLLAAALPISTGKRSYTSPFLLQMFSRGRNKISLGLIDSLSITRGTGNVGWTADGKPLGIDVSFSVLDLSNVMHMPIAPFYNYLNPLDGVIDDDNAWSDYMATLSSMSVADSYYPTRKFILNLTRKWTQFKSGFSSANVANQIVDFEVFGARPAQILGAFARAGQVTVGN